MAITLINGRAFDFSQIIASYKGVPLPSLSEINYEETQEKTNNMGTGNRAVSRGHGTIDVTGSMTLSQNDIEALREVAPNGSLLALPSDDFILVFTNPSNPQTHVIKDMEFTNDGGGGTTGDTDLTVTLNFVASEIKYR